MLVHRLSDSENQEHRKSLGQQLQKWSPKKVLVVGDIGVDEYVVGEVRRISPEAPVPIVEVAKEDRRLGLAANVAQNISSLGGEALLVAVVGDDQGAEHLGDLLKVAGVSPEHLIQDRHRPTTRKLRVMADHHHLVRVDFEKRQRLDFEVEKQILLQVELLLGECDAVVIEDYAKGMISLNLSQKVIEMARTKGKPVLADPHRSSPIQLYKGIDLLTPNRDEAVALNQTSEELGEMSEEVFLAMGFELLDKLQSQHLVITRGKQGMTYFQRDHVLHLPTFAKQVFDVAGAGDTVIATLALCWAQGLKLPMGCLLANIAAGLVVAKVGCVPCSKEELLKELLSH